MWAFKQLWDKGLIYDLPHDWADGSLDSTYRNAGIYRGMSGPGVTRIDTMVSNEVGAQLVSEVKCCWDTSGANDHVAIAMKLDGARVDQKVIRSGRPIGITLDQHKYAPAPKEIRSLLLALLPLAVVRPLFHLPLLVLLPSPFSSAPSSSSYPSSA